MAILDPIGKVGYVANSTYPVPLGCWSAGRLYDTFESSAFAVVRFVTKETIIAEILENVEFEIYIKEDPIWEDIVAREGRTYWVMNQEKEFISNAYEGFSEAYTKEDFPMCGMDANTITLLVAELARRVGKYDECSRWISKLLVSRDANDRIKERAREIRELLKENLQ